VSIEPLLSREAVEREAGGAPTKSDTQQLVTGG